MSITVLRASAAILFSLATAAHADSAQDWISGLSTTRTISFPASSAEATGALPGDAWLNALSTVGTRAHPASSVVVAEGDAGTRWIAALSTVKAPRAAVEIDQLAAAEAPANIDGAR